MQFQKQVTNANVDLCIQGCMSEYSGLPEYQTMDAIITYRFVWGCRINRLSRFAVKLQAFNDIRSKLEYSKSIQQPICRVARSSSVFSRSSALIRRRRVPPPARIDHRPSFTLAHGQSFTSPLSLRLKYISSLVGIERRCLYLNRDENSPNSSSVSM